MNLEQRIARLEAIDAIKQLKARYFFACDNKQPELVRGWPKTLPAKPRVT